MQQKWQRMVAVLVVLISFCGMEPVWAQEDVDEALAAAEREAKIQESLQRAREAEKEAAAAIAEMGEIAERSALETAELRSQAQQAALEAQKESENLRKAEFDAEKARIDAAKSRLPAPPDAEKYKLDAPQAATLTATAKYRNMSVLMGNGEEDSFAAALSSAIRVAGNKEQCNVVQKTLLLEDDKTRSEIALYKTTAFALDNAARQIKNRTAQLNRALSNFKQPSPAYFDVTPLILSNIAENALAFSRILRTQYAIGTAANYQKEAHEVVSAVVLGQLASDFRIVDPRTMINTQLDTAWRASAIPGDYTPDTDTLLGKLAAVAVALQQAQQKVEEASRAIQEKAAQAAAEKNTPKDKADAIASTRKSAQPLEDDIKKLTEMLATIEKQIEAMGKAEDGESAITLAQRGEMIARSITECTYLLSLKVISSDVDSVVRRRFFSWLTGDEIGIATNTLAGWRLSRPDGSLVASGIEQIYSPLTEVELFD